MLTNNPMTKQKLLPIENCPFCYAEKGVTSTWGIPTKGWEENKIAHSMGHKPTSINKDCNCPLIATDKKIIHRTWCPLVTPPSITSNSDKENAFTIKTNDWEKWLEDFVIIPNMGGNTDGKIRISDYSLPELKKKIKALIALSRLEGIEEGKAYLKEQVTHTMGRDRIEGFWMAIAYLEDLK